MITIRKSSDRGHTKIDWLDSKHSFSFGEYRDFNYNNFGPLRVINEDIVAKGAGFETHGHRDMEIITYVLNGQLAHKDSLGNGTVINAGDVQRMSAGTGIRHSEFNHSKDQPVHFLQIWIYPEQDNLPPSYEQKPFADVKPGQLRLVASKDGRDGSVKVHQDTGIYIGKLIDGQSIEHSLPEKRKAWLQVARGQVNVNGVTLSQGDGAAIVDEKNIRLSSIDTSEVMLFDLAA